MSESNDGRPRFGPSLVLTNLYEVKTRDGRTYFRGRLGASRIVLMSTGETGSDGAPIWSLSLQESLDGKLKPKRETSYERRD